MKNYLLLFFLLIFGFIFSQKADNSFHGYFQEKGDETFYKNFEFDGNGKVLIAGMNHGDYFTRNDSLIVYPDKSIFIFKIQKKGNLKGISNWVDKGIWLPKNDSLVENKRTNNEKALKQASLLAEYYDNTKGKSELDALFSENKSTFRDNLCERGLSKACLDLFGIKMLETTPGLLTNAESIPSKKLKPNQELINLSKKIVALGDPEGHTVLGSYYYVLGLKSKANIEWDKAIKMGSSKGAMAKGMIEFSENIYK